MRRSLFAFAFALALIPAVGVEASGPLVPPLETPEKELAAALHCPEAFDDDEHGPVLLVHGTFTEDHSNWGWNYRPALTSLGFDVCSVDLPEYSLIDMQIQAEYIVYAVRQLASRTGERVDMIGASQGTLHPRWAVKWWPDVRLAVDDVIQLAAPNHGTSATDLAFVFGRCYAACWQMAVGSNYLAALNESDETPGDVSYTSIYTIFDELVTPQLPESTSELEGASNIAVQDVCPGRPVEHTGLVTGDAVAFALALDALTHPGATDPARFDIATCAQALMPGAEPLALFNGEGSASFEGEFVDEEPPLKAYARSSGASAGQEGGEEEAGGEDGSSAAPEQTPSAPHEDRISAEEVAVAGTSLPATGANVLAIVALSLTLVAGGGNLLQARRVRRSWAARGSR